MAADRLFTWETLNFIPAINWRRGPRVVLLNHKSWTTSPVVHPSVTLFFCEWSVGGFRELQPQNASLELYWLHFFASTEGGSHPSEGQEMSRDTLHGTVPLAFVHLHLFSLPHPANELISTKCLPAIWAVRLFKHLRTFMDFFLQSIFIVEDNYKILYK